MTIQHRLGTSVVITALGRQVKLSDCIDLGVIRSMLERVCAASSVAERLRQGQVRLSKIKQHQARLHSITHGEQHEAGVSGIG